MTALIKKQLAKLLAPYFEGMTADNFSLSFFKGKGGLKDLRLNTALINDSLPPWFSCKLVHLEKFSLKIPWTRLKKKPVKAIISNVRVVLEFDPTKTEVKSVAAKAGKDKKKKKKRKSSSSSSLGDEEGKASSSSSDSSKGSKGTKYGLIDSIIDGVQVSVENVEVIVKAPDFRVTVTVSGVLAKSATKDWLDFTSLKQTRVKDKKSATIHVFKHVTLDRLRVKIEIPKTATGREYEPAVFQLAQPILRMTKRLPTKHSHAAQSLHFQFLLKTIHLTLTEGQLQTLDMFYDSVSKDLPNLLETWQTTLKEAEKWAEDIHLEKLKERESEMKALEEAEEKKKAKKKKKKKSSSSLYAGQGSSGGGVGELELAPEKVNSFHVHIDKILLRIAKGSPSTRSTATATEASSTKNGQFSPPSTTYLLSLTLNGIKFHHFYKHAFGAAIPHNSAQQAFFVKHGLLNSALVPAVSLDHVHDFRVNSTLAVVERILLVIDATPVSQGAAAGNLRKSVSSASLASLSSRGVPASASGSKAKVILLQPHSVEQGPMFTVALTSYTHAPGKADLWKTGYPTPPPSIFVDVLPLKFNADVAAIFEVASFLVDAINANAEHAARWKDAASPPSEQDDKSVGSLLGRRLSMASTSTDATSVSATTSTSTQKGGGKSSSASSSSAAKAKAGGREANDPVIHVCIHGAHLQLPPVIASAKERHKSILMTIGVREVVLSNRPRICLPSGGFGPKVHNPNSPNADTSVTTATGTGRGDGGNDAAPSLLMQTTQFYNGWLYRRSTAFPQEGSAAFLPPASDMAGLVAGTLDGSDMVVCVNGLDIVVEKSEMGRKSSPIYVLDACDLIVRVCDRNDKGTFVMVELSGNPCLHVTHELVAYAMNIQYVLQTMPFHEVSAALSKFQAAGTTASQKNSSDSDSDGEEAKKTAINILLPSVTLSLNDGDQDILYVRAHETQVAVTQEDDAATLVRVVVAQLALSQMLQSVSGDIVRQQNGEALQYGGDTMNPTLTGKLSSGVGDILKAAHPSMATQKTPGMSSSSAPEGLGEPQVACLIRMASQTADQKRRAFTAFQERHAQARRVQYHLGRDAARARVQSVVDPKSLRKAVALIDADVEDDFDQDRQFVDDDNDADYSTVGDDEDEGDNMSLSSADDVDIAADEFEGVEAVEPAWVQAERWAGESIFKTSSSSGTGPGEKSSHDKHILDCVDTFLSSKYYALFSSAALEVGEGTSPPPMRADELLTYIPMEKPPKMELAVKARGISATLDQVPLGTIGNIFNTNPDPLDAFPLPPYSPIIKVDVEGVSLSLLNGAYLERLPLYVAASRGAIVNEATRRITIDALSLAIAEDGSVRILNNCKQMGEDSATTEALLRRQLRQTQDELIRAKQVIEGCMQALAFSTDVLETVKMQTRVAMENQGVLDEEEEEVEVGRLRLADHTMAATLHQIITSNLDTTI